MSRLRLREVRLSGFKTFADKTTIAFTPGITAIVGPNGSGKSNIVDALRWGFGEAGRGIRSKRVDEVIFAGSEKRRQLGLAEVTLSIANDDGLFDLPFTELEISRRADRGGGSPPHRPALRAGPVRPGGRPAGASRPERCAQLGGAGLDRKSTRLNSSHMSESRMPSSA